MITYHGRVNNISSGIFLTADEIKHLNYKTTTPAKFRKNTLTEDLAKDFMNEVSLIIKTDRAKLDYVYFSAARGAEPHTDLLDPDQFLSTTFIVPIILPRGKTVIHAENDNATVHVGGIYEFNHEKTHSMTVEDIEGGCVVIMIAIRK